jgi:HAD superfamily hydrolase (TIGR01484 family)
MHADQDLEQTIILTDMDGCYIDDRTAKDDLSRDAYDAAIEAEIPISFVTGKSAALALLDIRRLDNPFPLIAENGSVIYVPEDFLSRSELEEHEEFRPWLADEERVEDNATYNLLEYNIGVDETTRFLHELQKELPFEIRLYTEMSPQELGRDVGYDLELAKLDQMKEYHLPVKIGTEFGGFDDDEEKIARFKQELEDAGYTWSRGRYHLVGKGRDNNEVSKEEACKALKQMYEIKYPQGVFTVGLGDSQSDHGMEEWADKGYQVAKPKGHVELPENSSIIRVDGTGPEGWAMAINALLEGKPL